MADQVVPEDFVIHTTLNGREGYALYRWTNGGLTNDQRIIHVVKAHSHGNRYYNITRDETLPTTYSSAMVKKGQGRIVRTMSWRYNRHILVNGTRRYPVINITAHSMIPSHRIDSFIPIITDVPAQPVAPVVPKIYPILAIPQHAVRGLLRDAAMQEETCSITGENIDISNGAITSCFHLFEKNAIATWLAMPNSNDMCPICKEKCNIFMLNTA